MSVTFGLYGEFILTKPENIPMEEIEFRQKILPLQHLMYGIALKAGMPPDDAADTVQEALLRLWRARASLPGPSGEQRAYCLTVFRNTLLSNISSITSRAARRSDIPLDNPYVEKSVADKPEADSAGTRQDLERMINALPENQRKVIRLSGFGGLETDEIARATGLTAANVRQLLSRARRRLRAMMEIHN